MIQIKTVDIPFKEKKATQLYAQVNSFATDATTCDTYWKLLSQENETLLDGNIPMGEEDFANYGQDNSYVDDFILNALKLERATEEEILAREKTEEII